MDDSVYPPVAEDDDGFGATVVRALRDLDEPHSAKAALLAKTAHTEWMHAVAEDEPEVSEDEAFADWMADAIDEVDRAVERTTHE